MDNSSSVNLMTMNHSQVKIEVAYIPQQLQKAIIGIKETEYLFKT